MKRLYRKFCILNRSLIGYWIKWKIDFWGIGKVKKILPKKKNSPRLIVSLTSYGRRVEKGIVYYTLVSLLKQTKQPDKIVLWLDSTTWSEKKLPKCLQQIRNYGVDILFCKDIRSYTKLIPALREFPEDIIVTVDDDVYYSSHLLELLYNAYIQDKSKIYCIRALEPLFAENHNLCHYNDWIEKPLDSPFTFPLGVGGVLYPPHSLHPDVCNEDLFMRLCPLADDVWFWMMAIRRGTIRQRISYQKYKNYSFDMIYQYFHKGSALTHSNSQQHMNDIQIENLFEYYGITNMDELK